MPLQDTLAVLSCQQTQWPALHRLWPASHRCNLTETGVKAGHTPLTSCPVVLWHHREREQREPAQDTHVPPGRGSSSYLQGLLSLPQADNPKTNSLRPGMVASSAVCPVFAFPPSPFPSPEPSHLLAGTTFQLNTLKIVLQAVLSETPRVREVLSGCGISEENPGWLPGKGGIWVEPWNLAMHWWRENHGCRNTHDTKKRSLESLKHCVDGDSGKDGREAGDIPRKLWILDMECGFPWMQQVAKRSVLGLRRIIWLWCRW